MVIEQFFQNSGLFVCSLTAIYEQTCFPSFEAPENVSNFSYIRYLRLTKEKSIPWESCHCSKVLIFTLVTEFDTWAMCYR